MTSISRRDMITGAVALLSVAHLPRAITAQQLNRLESGKPDDLSLPAKPKDLLTSTFTPELLSRALIPASTWHPYPKADEREAWQAVPPGVGAAIVQRAEAVLKGEWASLPATVFLEYKRIGNRSHFEHLYFTRRQRVTDLALGECIEGNGRFLDEIVNGIWLTCEETFWGLPAHLYLQKDSFGSGLPETEEPIVDLFAAETGATLSWIHYLLGMRLNQVSPLIAKRIEIEVKRRILDPALERNDFSWMFKDVSGKRHRLNNWTTWIDSNWMAATLLLENDPSRRIRTILKICKSLDQYLLDYPSDGGCEEGPGYWQVSPASYYDCCSLLTSSTNGAANVLTNPFIRKMEHYILDTHIAGPYYVNYGDASPQETISGELVYRIGAGVGDKALAAFGAFNTSVASVRSGTNSDGQGRLAKAMPDILSAASARSAEKADALERDSWYPALCLMTARAKANTSAGFYLAAQMAPNARSHGHNDSGSFIVFHDGEPVFIDIGPEAYTAPRYKWTVQSAYHNLPTVGGVMQSATNAKYRASDVQYVSDDAHAALSMNLATAYPDEAGIRSWIRSIVLDRNADCIHLREDFQLLRKVPITLAFITSRVPSHGSEGSIVLSASGKKGRDVSLKFDISQVVASIETIKLKDEWLQSRWGERIYRVLLTSTQPTDSGKWMLEII